MLKSKTLDFLLHTSRFLDVILKRHGLIRVIPEVLENGSFGYLTGTPGSLSTSHVVRFVRGWIGRYFVTKMPRNGAPGSSYNSGVL